MNGDVAAVKEAGEGNLDAADGDSGGVGGAARDLEAALQEESRQAVAVGKEAELGDGEAARDDVES